MNLKKIFSIVLVVAISLALLIGCNNNDNPGSEPSSGSGSGTDSGTDSEKRDDVIIGTSSPITKFHPNTANARIEQDILNVVCDTLIELNYGEYTSRLAESFELSDDGMALTVKLREGVKFHNGETLTTEDVKYTFDCISDPLATMLTTYAPFYDGVEIVDELTCIIKSKFPTALFMNMVSTVDILNKTYYEAAGNDSNPDPIGTGPYKFVSYDGSNNLYLTRFDDYYGEPAAIKDIAYRIILDQQTLMIALESGEIDIANKITPALAMQIEDNKDYDVTWVNGEGIYIIICNTEKAPFDNSKVRQAMSYALDREAINIIAQEGKGVVADAFMSPAMVAAPTEIFHYERDLEKAKSLLAEAGYPDGLVVEAPMVIMKDYEKFAVAIQQQLAEVGIQFEIELLEQNALFAQLDGTYTFMTMSLSQETLDMANACQFLDSSNIGTYNIARYNNSEVNDLIQKAAAEPDVANRKALYTDIFEIVQQEMPYVPFLYKQEAVAKVHNLNHTEEESSSIQPYKLSWQ